MRSKRKWAKVARVRRARFFVRMSFACDEVQVNGYATYEEAASAYGCALLVLRDEYRHHEATGDEIGLLSVEMFDAVGRTIFSTDGSGGGFEDRVPQLAAGRYRWSEVAERLIGLGEVGGYAHLVEAETALARLPSLQGKPPPSLLCAPDDVARAAGVDPARAGPEASAEA